ncbi:DUF1616 domain-containing protein [Vulcanisaeta distributa]|uniref:DUF1616 domain-containing protein n=1 Tax=Vulcanisaeta distributa (strain DSM 14429 / JCM 11212 / NBRC 100878 / IC-017) TaxID=572478 RepID=E1QUB7_VULDI|nr:DUF1616 domain-containing protein [Vulcanisaeta distributa]ADN49843.1 Protein of unknown function DUF1616 [Vulcanisaeta distributa DSM 14429]
MSYRYLLLLVLLLTALGIALHAQQLGALTAYQYIVELSRLGVNTTSLVNELNNAISLEASGQVGNASTVIGSIVARAQSLIPGARLWYMVGIVIKAVVVAGVVALSVMFYVKRRELIGLIWLRVRGGNRVRGGGPGRPRTFIFSEEVVAVALSIVIILIVFLTAQSIVSGYTQPFSAIGLLGPTGKLGDYPSTVVVGQPISLYIYVYNHMGVPTWFVVRVFVTNNTVAQPPLNQTPIMVFQRVLLNNESWIEPLTLSINSTGTYRIIGELWMYSPSNLTLVYTGKYVQLWVNVTQVMPSG